MIKVLNTLHNLFTILVSGISKLRKFKSLFFLFFLVGVSSLLTACNVDMSFLSPKGVISAQQLTLFYTSIILMCIVVIPVIILIFVFAWKYRASNKNAKYSPDWSHSTKIEVCMWTIPCVIILALAIITWISSHDLDPYKPLKTKNNEKPIVIQAVALEWKWLFIYPEQNIATVNYLQFPANVPITFKITSDAPMNSFMIPRLAGQIYAMEGMQSQLHLMANEEGIYPGRSTNFSGDGFSGMIFTAKASSKVEYQAWIQEVKSSSNNLTMKQYNKLSEPSESNKVEYFSTVDHELFKKIIMKFMPSTEHSIDTNTNQEIQL
ncbi:MAG: cytochrome o ubiquinol oxidase subunit 2 [Francisellaceae bacterium]|jgi:cytochrome o ubiquinol oxidase subunit 2